MAKQNTGKQPQNQNPVQNQMQQQLMMRSMVASVLNATGTQTREALLARLLNPRIDINYECRYPNTITRSDYKAMFDRNSVGHRVVDVWPAECWVQAPEVKASDNTAVENQFDKAFKELDKERQVLHYLKRIDVLSGIGRFGILVLGIDDGKKLSDPVESINPATGELTGKGKSKLLYLKPYDESVVVVKDKEKSTKSPRYGMPTSYQVKMENITSGNTKTPQYIHWTRVLHVADNRMSSEVFGEPRMQPIWNNLLDLRKIAGGAAEMYWRAGIGGTAWGLDKDIVEPTVTLTEDQKEQMQEDLQQFYDGMQRYLFTEGLKPMDIAPKLESPEDVVRVQVQLLCLAIGIPYRVFIGTEEGKLASGQDRIAWLERVAGRQNNYLTPMLVRPFVKRMQDYGVLPEAKGGIVVEWPHRDSPSEKEIADTALKLADAMSRYVRGDVELVMGPEQFLAQVLKKSEEDIAKIADEVDNWGQLIDSMNEDDLETIPDTQTSRERPERGADTQGK
jgi:hypothetical protein